MISRLFRILTSQPSLLLDHVDGYVDLVRAESGDLARHYALRAVWGLVALAAGAMGLGLAGVAAMLGATVGAPSDRAMWALIGIPIAFLVVAGVAAWAATSAQAQPFARVRRQFDLDRHMVDEWTDEQPRVA